MRGYWMHLAILVAVLSLVTGCASVAPKVIHYAQPSLQIDRAIYDSVPCDPDKWWEPCTALGVGCKALLRADSLLGGLSPSYPIAACLLSEGLGGLYTQPCRGGGPVGYFVLREGQYQMIASESELRELYAPIESEDEALSYALAATGYQARNFTTDLPQHAYPVPGEVDYFVNELEDTHVTKSQEGYRVRLYDYTWCGCGHHETYAMEVLVTASGVISTTKGAPVYQLRASPCFD